MLLYKRPAPVPGFTRPGLYMYRPCNVIVHVHVVRSTVSLASTYNKRVVTTFTLRDCRADSLAKIPGSSFRAAASESLPDPGCHLARGCDARPPNLGQALPSSPAVSRPRRP